MLEKIVSKLVIPIVAGMTYVTDISFLNNLINYDLTPSAYAGDNKYEKTIAESSIMFLTKSEENKYQEGIKGIVSKLKKENGDIKQFDIKKILDQINILPYSKNKLTNTNESFYITELKQNVTNIFNYINHDKIKEPIYKIKLITNVDEIKESNELIVYLVNSLNFSRKIISHAVFDNNKVKEIKYADNYEMNGVVIYNNQSSNHKLKYIICTVPKSINDSSQMFNVATELLHYVVNDISNKNLRKDLDILQSLKLSIEEKAIKSYQINFQNKLDEEGAVHSIILSYLKQNKNSFPDINDENINNFYKKNPRYTKVSSDILRVEKEGIHSVLNDLFEKRYFKEIK